MNTEIIQRMQGQFDAITHTAPDEGVEFWFARDLQELLEHTIDRLETMK